ncbi:concanavalin A-like lectin/glucanase domain-containing protein [Truncatella angustata]|uniref:Concanavalin A-like lectin/glucanase domain-containing protein n=1 Tax=Truncatella angustata TaxID=152316 RepID=A0A9P8U8N2_9PEZI|nr:concanavalin A-like lectin/glucanase domain-containing protein [Truncatella angustata]KAH6645379.1 concanavalin A-like lectin/glucanase domain-containing protein [Truncatella angustata]KAH8193539.1 hypothetical protein TruAng_012295 [Truncatella angustata]
MLKDQLPRISLAALAFPQISWSIPLASGACDCWQNKEDGLLFTSHTVIDFRSLADYVDSVPDVIDDHDANANAQATSAYFGTSAWSDFFNLQTWGTDDTPVKMINSRNNAYIQQDTEDSTYLTLRTHRSSEFQSAAEAESIVDDFTTVSMRMRARVHGDSGACAGFFTYKADEDSGVQHESDIEFLTVDSATTMHYTTHPEEENNNNDGEFSVAATLSNAWTDWQEHRLDWTQSATTFYVNGEQNGQLEHEVAQVPSYLIFNMWSWGNNEWEQEMDVGGTAYLDVQYIEIAYNTSGGSSTSCSNICFLG